KEGDSERRTIRFGSYGDLPRGPAAADGTFHMLLPQEPLRIWYRPVPGIDDLYARGPDIMPPPTGLRVRLAHGERKDTRNGFELRGCVVAAATQQPVSGFRVEMIERTGNGSSMGLVACRTNSDGTFAIGPVHDKGELTFEFEAEGYAPAMVGPFHP